MLEQVGHRELGVTARLLDVGGSGLVGDRHVAEQRDQREQDRIEREERHVALDYGAPLGRQRPGDGVRVEEQRDGRAKGEGGEVELGVAGGLRGRDKRAERLLGRRIDRGEMGLRGPEDVG